MFTFWTSRTCCRRSQRSSADRDTPCWTDRLLVGLNQHRSDDDGGRFCTEAGVVTPQTKGQSASSTFPLRQPGGPSSLAIAHVGAPGIPHREGVCSTGSIAGRREKFGHVSP